jgi:hypothetical protein
MSRNLCTSVCPKCSYTLKLSDVRGKPVEFRRYGKYAPTLGVRFDCECGEVYFVAWRSKDAYWSRESLDSGEWKKPVLEYGGRQFPNQHQGKFAFETPAFMDPDRVLVQNTGVFTLDLSHYETYDDEPMEDGPEKTAIQRSEQQPWHLCTDDAEDTQWVWTSER